MATLDELIKKLEANKASAYTPLTQQQMQQQAANRYSGLYDQKRLSAQQQYDTADQALAQQLAGLDDQYKKQLEQSAKNYEGTYRAADRQALGRGMQRSSYNSATLANINLKGAEAQQAIRDTQAAQAKNIGEQRRLLAQQLGDTLAGYDAAQQSDMLAYLDELEAREYDRQRADTAMRNDLAMKLYQYQFQKEQADQEQANWLKTFNAANGSGSGSVSRATAPAAAATGAVGSTLWGELNANPVSTTERKKVSGVRRNQTNAIN